jgi:hypothetical protein
VCEAMERVASPEIAKGFSVCRSQCAGCPLAGRRRSAGAGACGKLSTLGAANRF